MRIISGKYKSRRIKVSHDLKARPTTDFAKEGIFDILNNLLDWEATTALDLFSGTGSIALEMVSRGCPRVVSVEISGNHYDFIVKTKETLAANELFPIRADVFKFIASCNEKFDLIFADPPYDLPGIDTIPTFIIEKNLLKPEGIFIMEHSDKHRFSHLPFFKEERKYGRVHFSIFENKK
ncbi:MAG: RsmD family RNA methyltransferase, partial [Dysgonamonadaceae bacterium]|nr:RsmD family RNA methyltransferase [Dysgonamonadaceae bacterium]